MNVRISLLVLVASTGACRAPDERMRDTDPRSSVSSADVANEDSTAASIPRATRAAAWAVPIERPGLPNLHQVTPTIYRSAQPSDSGFVELERMGVRTVLSLRAFHADIFPIGSSLPRERISFKSWHPEAEDIERFFRCVMDPSRHPVLVHCQHGADRTGMMLALYRIAVQGWSKDDAIREMVQGGYGFHSIWTNLVEYVRAADVEELQELARRSSVRSAGS